MFDKQYRFKGRHALRVDQLTSAFDGESKAQLFGRNVDVYTNASLVGFLYGRTAEQDDTKNPETNQVYNQNVMGDRVIYSQEELMFNFRLIMLLDKQYEPDEGKAGVEMSAHGRASHPCPNCGKFIEFDYDNLTAKIVKPFRGAAHRFHK